MSNPVFLGLLNLIGLCAKPVLLRVLYNVKDCSNGSKTGALKVLVSMTLEGLRERLSRRALMQVTKVESIGWTGEAFGFFGTMESVLDSCENPNKLIVNKMNIWISLFRMDEFWAVKLVKSCELLQNAFFRPSFLSFFLFDLNNRVGGIFSLAKRLLFWVV